MHLPGVNYISSKNINKTYNLNPIYPNRDEITKILEFVLVFKQRLGRYNVVVIWKGSGARNLLRVLRNVCTRPIVAPKRAESI